MNGGNGNSNGISNGAPIKTNKITSDKSANFAKGALIELSSGDIRRVEDMRKEDFIAASRKNPNLQLIDTTVVKMALQSTQVVLVTVSYNNRNVSILMSGSRFRAVYSVTLMFGRVSEREREK